MYCLPCEVFFFFIALRKRACLLKHVSFPTAVIVSSDIGVVHNMQILFSCL